MRKTILISSRSRVSTDEETKDEKWGIRDGKCLRAGFYHSPSRRVVHDMSIKLIDPWTAKRNPERSQGSHAEPRLQRPWLRTPRSLSSGRRYAQ